MSGRIFQNSVLQFKETTDRTIGVIDAEGTVIACSELTAIGKRWSKYVEPIVSADGTCVAGPCRGEGLREVAVHCAEGEVRLGASPAQ